MAIPTGRVQVGKRYYFIVHAYHHLIADVEEILGKKHIATGPQAWIYSCRRGWTEFFRDGAKSDTTCRNFPPGEFEYIAAFAWNHEIPKDNS